MMKMRPVSDLKDKFCETVSDVQNGTTVCLTQNGRGSAVLLSHADSERLANPWRPPSTRRTEWQRRPPCALRMKSFSEGSEQESKAIRELRHIKASAAGILGHFELSQARSRAVSEQCVTCSIKQYITA